MNLKSTCAVVLLLARAGLARAAQDKKLGVYWVPDFQLLVETQKDNRPRQEKVLDLLGLKPGMTIVDIGAGTGQLDYLMADRLKGTGRICATDIDQDYLDYITQQARERGLRNVEAVRVQPEGLDPFYRSRKWDLAVLYNMPYLHHRPRFYRELVENFAPGGRLVIVADRGSYPPFTRDDFTDWKGFVSALESEPEDSPLRRISQHVLQSLQEQGPRADESRIVLFFLNKELEGDLFASLVRGGEFKPEVALTPLERPFASWLLGRLTLAGFPDKRNLVELMDIEERNVLYLNKLMIIQRYRKYLRSDLPHPYITAGFEGEWSYQHDHNTRELLEAGLKIERIYDLSPFQAVWVAVKPQR